MSERSETTPKLDVLRKLSFADVEALFYTKQVDQANKVRAEIDESASRDNKEEPQVLLRQFKEVCGGLEEGMSLEEALHAMLVRCTQLELAALQKANEAEANPSSQIYQAQLQRLVAKKDKARELYSQLFDQLCDVGAAALDASSHERIAG